MRVVARNDLPRFILVITDPQRVMHANVGRSGTADYAPN